VDPAGDQLSFGTSGDGVAMTNVMVPIAWEADQWHQVVLSYSVSNSVIYLDGMPAATGSGIAHYPDLGQAVAGFSVGSGKVPLWELINGQWVQVWSGTDYVRGTIDQLATFNAPLTGEYVQSSFEAAARDSDGDGVADTNDAFPFDPSRWLPTNNATGPIVITLTVPVEARQL
jgi:hypothetical protein